MQNQNIFAEIERQKDELTQTLMELIRVPAVAPENGGEGETKKAEKLVQILKTTGFDKIERFDAKDDRVPSKNRPNIIAYYGGESETEKLWIITHMDVVPPGEESLWTVTKPFEPITREGRIYGRGSEDNGQSMVASIFAVKALKSLGDSGNEDGSFIEIAEKSAVWFRIRTIGKQTHASRPDRGLNAHRVGMEYALALDRMLHERCSLKNAYFEPPESTIEPTKKDKNVDAVNIIPGEDIVYFDCRILPNYSLDEIINDIQKLAEEFEKKTGAKIKFEIQQKSVAPKPTDANAKIVTMLEEAIRKIRRVEPKVGGIGGGTCAAFFRRIGIPAVVWSTIDETGHQPNEYAKIENLVNDAKIFAYLAIS